MSTKTAADFLSEMEESDGLLTFATLLVGARESMGWSQAELARRAGVKRGTVCDLEKGRSMPTPARAAKLAVILEHSETQFVRRAAKDWLRRQGFDGWDVVPPAA